VDVANGHAGSGGLTKEMGATNPAKPRRTVHLLQRKAEPPGKGLGKSTGWILKARLRRAHLMTISGATYDAIDDQGLHYRVDGVPQTLAVDHVVLCAGQNANRALFDELAARGIRAKLIGGADVAAELDALRAIDQATRLAVEL
jgi:2,4-dienoyl-CoA reductase (NADPH2)